MHEQAVFARLGSWQQRFDNIHHLLLAELKVEQISKLSSKGEHVPEELKLNLDERWLIYRKYHWEYALIQVSEYLARCARAQTANYIYVSRETLAEFESAARKPMEEEDKIMLVIQCLKAGLSELRRELRLVSIYVLLARTCRDFFTWKNVIYSLRWLRYVVRCSYIK